MSQPSIPAIAVISTALISMPAPATSQPHAMTRTTTSPATSAIRSRLSIASSEPAAMAALGLWSAELLLVLLVAVHLAVRPPGDIRHRAMAAVQIELDRAGTLGEAGDILCLVKHPAVRYHCNDLMLHVGNWVADRLAMRADYVRHLDARSSLVQVPIEGYRCEQRILDRFDDDREDLKHGADRLVRAGHDIKQCFPLRVVGALVDNRMHYPLAMMNGARKVKCCDDR